MRKIRLVARVQHIENGTKKYKYENVVTADRKGRPVNPVEPQFATAFYLRFTRGGKQVMEPAGQNFLAAVNAMRQREINVEYERRGLDAPAVENDQRRTIADAAAQFIRNQSTLDKSAGTVYGYTKAVNAFRSACGKVYIDQITRQDVLDHIQWLRDNLPKRAIGQQNGTIRTRLQYLSVFFLGSGLNENPLPKREWPKVEERKVEAYTTEQVNQMLSAATVDERDLILFLLCTGFRDDEVAHSVYADVNFKTHEIKVGPKPEINFTTKNGKERSVRVPGELIDALQARRERNPDGVLIFPNRNGGSDSALLYRVRKAAERAGITERITLHKFRKTFGTRYGEKHGIVNAQHLLGHADIRTTQKYLAQTKIAKSAVEALFEDVVGK